MSIESIQIEKFKSYANCRIEGFSNKINILFGKNGSGKSNLLAALQFLCSDQYDRADRAQLMKNYREGDPKVEVKMCNLIEGKKDMIAADAPPQQKILPTSGDSVVVSRSLEERENVYRVDDRTVNLNQFNNIFECFGLQRKNPFTIIAQNRVQEIANMTDSELYRLLEQVAGVDAFISKQQKAEELFAKAQKEKTGIEVSLQEIEDKISQLGGEKQHYAESQEHEILLSSLQWLFYEKTKEEISKKKQDCDKEVNEKNEQLQAEKEKLTNLQSSRESKHEELQRMKDQLQRLITLEDQVKADYSSAEAKSKTLIAKLGDLKNLQNEAPDKDKMEQRLKEIQTQEDQLHAQLAGFADKIQGEKIRIEESQSSYEKLVLREKFKTVAEKDKYCAESLKELKQRTTDNASEQKKVRSKLSENEKKLVKATSELDSLFKSVDQAQAETNTLQATINDKKKSIQKIRQEQLERRKEVSETQLELELVDEKLKKKAEDIHKQLKSGLLAAIDRIEYHIKSENIQGYLGLLIDHIDFHPKLTFAYDIAEKGKLFSIVVDNEETAEKVMRIARRADVKGGNLNIYPLSWVEDDIEEVGKKPNNGSNSAGFQKLFDSKYLKAKGAHAKQITQLARDIFEKYCVIKDYEQALEVAAKFRLNCITENRQVVYSSGFISRVGFCSSSKADKITLYAEYKQLKNNKTSLSEKIGTSDAKILELDEKLSTFNRDFSKASAALAKVTNASFMSKQLLRSAELDKKLLSDEAHQLTTRLDTLKQQHDDVNSEIKSVEEMKTSPAFEPLSESEKQRMFALNESTKESTTALNSLMREKNRVEKSLHESKGAAELIRRRLSNSMDSGDSKRQADAIVMQIKQTEEDLKNIEVIVNMHKKFVSRSTEKKVAFNKSISKAEDEALVAAQEHEESIQNLKSTCSNLETAVSAVLLKKQQYIQKENEIEAKKDSLSVSPDLLEKYRDLSRDALRARLSAVAQETTIKKYTARDRILFDKLAELDEKNETYKTQYANLIKNEQAAKNLINEFREKCDATIKQAFAKFENYLRVYFLRLAPNGSLEVQLLHNHQVSIQLTFKESAVDTKKTNRRDLSGGEKSCLAILVLMAFQKCDPAPFYIFDEFDAALDQNFIQQIAKIISENSRKSQFVIVSHKPEFLASLKQEDCKCFQISLRDKISEIEATSLQDAIQFVKSGR